MENAGNPVEFLKTYLRQTTALRMSMKRPGDDWTYSGAEDYILDRGRLFDCSTPLTDEERDHLEAIAARSGCDFATKECFGNAQSLVLSDYAEDRFRYCEGYACRRGGFPMLHAWATINDKVVDLTWRKELKFKPGSADVIDRDHGTWENRILGEAPEGWVYFGCDDFGDRPALRKRLLKHEAWMSFLCPELARDDDWMERYRLPRIGEPPADLAAQFAALCKATEALRTQNG